MAGKRKPQVTTTASFLGTEGADNAPSTVREPGAESIHADPENPPSGKLMEEVPPAEQTLVDGGFVKVVALMNFQCYGIGTGMYPLTKNEQTWVHKDHLDSMLRANVVRELRDGE